MRAPLGQTLRYLYVALLGLGVGLVGVAASGAQARSDVAVTGDVAYTRLFRDPKAGNRSWITAADFSGSVRREITRRPRKGGALERLRRPVVAGRLAARVPAGRAARLRSLRGEPRRWRPATHLAARRTPFVGSLDRGPRLLVVSRRTTPCVRQRPPLRRQPRRQWEQEARAVLYVQAIVVAGRDERPRTSWMAAAERGERTARIRGTRRSIGSMPTVPIAASSPLAHLETLPGRPTVVK